MSAKQRPIFTFAIIALLLVYDGPERKRSSADPITRVYPGDVNTDKESTI